MARRIIIGEILNLIKGLGGNPNKFMGTRTNINFLGKGPKESLFQGAVDAQGMRAMDFPIETIIREAESAGGYATANKLNDLQLQRLKDNLIQLKKAYFPPQIPNITDMASGTGDLTQEGIASLREGVKRFPKESHQFFGRPLKDKDFAEIERLVAEGEIAPSRKTVPDPDFPKGFWFTKKDGTRVKMTGNRNLDYDYRDTARGYEEIPGSEGAYYRFGEKNKDFIGAGVAGIQERMKNIQKMADDLAAMGKGDVRKDYTYTILDPTAEKASYASRFNPKNEIHVNKAEALLKDPQIKGVYTEAEVKNAYDFDGLYQSHFDKGHVDIARLFEQEGHNIPQMRASARDALLQLMKKEKGLPGAETGLRDFVSDIDFKYITEGGGGRAGDPINLMVKYFGKNATENLPKSATKENINVFTDFIVKARDRRGRGIDDPFFDRETIDFSTFTRAVDDVPFRTGGRVGFRLGGFGGKFTKAQVLIARLKNTIKGSKDKYVQETFPNFIKEIEANPKLAENENVWKALGGDLPKDQRLVVHGDDTVDFFTQTKFGPHNIENITKFLEQHPFLTREEAMRILKMEPEDRILEITRLETIRRTPNASGGLAKILEV